MKNRTIKKQFWFNRDEVQELQKKAKKTCLSEAGLIRLLIKGYEPREKPGEEFYEVMKEVSKMANKVQQLSVKMQPANPESGQLLGEEVKRWHLFQDEIERQYLRPVSGRQKWQ